MKKLFLFLGIVVFGVLPSLAGQPVPESCTVGNRLFTCPLEEIGFYFDGGIKLLEGASATVKCQGEIVATAVGMEVSNYTYRRTQGSLAIYFDYQLLPKGKDYTVTVAPGSIASETDGTPNAEFSRNFTVPENLGPGRFDAEDGTVITRTSHFDGLPWCYWGIETEPAGEPVFILYRENTRVREFAASIGWDWDLGQAHAEINDELRFEKGVHYSLVLPAGSAHAIYRDDIVNEEMTFYFIGGYEEPVAPLNYVWCSLFTDHSDVLDVVSFTYDRPVRLADGAKLLLRESETGFIVKEAYAYLESQTDSWIVSADFGGFQMIPETGYTLVIPEGVVIAESGDPVVNAHSALHLNGTSGLTDLTVKETRADNTFYNLSGHEIKNPVPGRIYITKGRQFTVR